MASGSCTHDSPVVDQKVFTVLTQLVSAQGNVVDLVEGALKNKPAQKFLAVHQGLDKEGRQLIRFT